MADEAVVRVVVQPEGGQGRGAGQGAGAGAAPAPPAGKAPSAPRGATGAGDEKTGLDVAFDLMDRLRGSIGGLFGTVIGSTLDFMSAVRALQKTTASAPATPPSGANISAAAGMARSAVSGRPTAPGSTAITVNPARTPPTPAGTASTAAQAAESSTAGTAASAAAGVGLVVAFALATKAVGTAAHDATSAVGGFAASLVSASPDPAQFVATIGDTTTKISSALLLASPPLSIFGQALGGAVESLSGVMQNLDGMVSRYAQFSPELSAAQAQAEIRQTMGDMRRAQEAGPSLAAYIDKRADLQEKFEDAKARFMEELMPTVLKLMTIAEELLPLVQLLATAVAAIGQIIPDIRTDTEKLADEARAKAANELAEKIGGPLGTFLRGDFNMAGVGMRPTNPVVPPITAAGL